MNNNIKNALIVTGVAVAAFLVYKYVINKDEAAAPAAENKIADAEDKPVVEQVVMNAPAMV